MQTTCWTMIKAASRGDQDERGRFVSHYGPVLRGYLRLRWKRLVRRSEVEDAVQETFLECFREGGALDHLDTQAPGGFRAYIFGIARNVALRCERRFERAPQELGSEVEDGLPASDTTPSAAFDRAWARSLLKHAADLMKTRAQELGEVAQRRVELLRLRFSESLPIREIAVRWGMEPEALYQEQYRARQEFKAALREVVGFHHGGSPEDIENECRRLQDLVR